MKKICIIGAGGAGREVLCLLSDLNKFEDVYCFMESKEYFIAREVMGQQVKPLSEFDPLLYSAIVAIGSSNGREKVVKQMPADTQYETLIHPNVINSKWNNIGVGSIISAGCILTCNIEIGKHSYLNRNCTIGHDCRIGNYFSAAPSVVVSGNCKIGTNVSLGANAALREKITVCNNTTIGMSGVVVKNILKPGVYIGNPVVKLRGK